MGIATTHFPTFFFSDIILIVPYQRTAQYQHVPEIRLPGPNLSELALHLETRVPTVLRLMDVSGAEKVRT